MCSSEIGDYDMIDQDSCEDRYRDGRVVSTRLVTGAFDCVEDGPSLSGKDSPPKQLLVNRILFL